MNPYSLGAQNDGGGLFGGLANAAAAVAGAVNAIKGNNAPAGAASNAAQNRAAVMPANPGPLGVPVLAWVAGGVLLLVGLFLALRKS